MIFQVFDDSLYKYKTRTKYLIIFLHLYISSFNFHGLSYSFIHTRIFVSLNLV